MEDTIVTAIHIFMVIVALSVTNLSTVFDLAVAFGLSFLFFLRKTLVCNPKPMFFLSKIVALKKNV